MGKPLNVIIPEEDANVGLPPLKMNDVDVNQLFVALGEASRKSGVVIHTGGATARRRRLTAFGRLEAS